MNNTLVVFTYARAGLGHLRVTKALMEGMPAGIDYTVFEPTDTSTEFIHRFGSTNVAARYISEWMQRGLPQRIFSRQYRNYLKKSSGSLLEQFVSSVKSKNKEYENIIVVSTHFGLAHQLGSIKKQLEKELNTKINLIVQITDDSPQNMWYVDTADTIFAPSEWTKKELEKYAKSEGLCAVDIKVASYPIIPFFAKPLDQQRVEERRNQYDPSKYNPINIAIPVSGAAVGMLFFLHLMDKLHKKSERFKFYVICRKAPFTEKFIETVRKKDYVKLYVSENYKEVVDLYDEVYINNVISAEVTKPSEQAFKALLDVNSVGGSFLFFADPVGRQEDDNIQFLKKHGFLSEKSLQRRGLLLPMGSDRSVTMIWDQYHKGFLLESFNNFQPFMANGETGSDGVSKFWKLILN